MYTTYLYTSSKQLKRLHLELAHVLINFREGMQFKKNGYHGYTCMVAMATMIFSKFW